MIFLEFEPVFATLFPVFKDFDSLADEAERLIYLAAEMSQGDIAHNVVRMKVLNESGKDPPHSAQDPQLRQ